VIIPGKDGEFSLDVSGDGPRLRWQAHQGYWTQVRLSRGQLIDAAEKMLSMAEAMKVDPLSCDFCGKASTDVQKLIAGPSTFICDECVDLCHGIVEDSRKESGK